MIYIYSVEKDTTANSIIDWLIKYREPFRRINDTDFFELFRDLDIFSKENCIHWFWKWAKRSDYNIQSFKENNNNKALNSAIIEEYNVIFDSFF